MTKRIPSKPTEYNGVRYRSRLEARWAVYFDRLGVKHTYEPEYDAGIAPAWPAHRVDFEVFNLPMWSDRAYVEIKPVCDLPDKEPGPFLEMLRALSSQTEFPIFVFYGTPSEFTCIIACGGGLVESTDPGGLIVLNLLQSFRQNSRVAAEFSESFRFW